MLTPIHPKDLDMLSITYRNPKDLPTGGKLVYLNFRDGPITLQTPKMFSPFGLKDWKGNHGYTLDLSFKGMESDPALTTFFEKIDELDEKIIDDCVGNSAAWLNRKIDYKEYTDRLYTRQLRYAYDKEGYLDERFPATFKLKVPYRDGYFIPDVYDSASREQIDLHEKEACTKGAFITAIIQCTGIWITGENFGLGWKVMQMIVEPPSLVRKFAFIDLD